MDFLYDVLHLLVHQLGGLLGIRLREVVAARAAGIVEGKGADLFAHAVVLDHRIGDLGHPLKVVESARGGLSVDDFLRHAAGDEGAHPVDDDALRGILPLLRKVPRQAEGVAARDDADLHHGVGIRQEPADEGVAGLVIGGRALLGGSHDCGLLPLEAADDAVHSLKEVFLHHSLVAVTGRSEGGLVADVGDVGAGEARSVLRHQLDVEVRGDLYSTEVDLEDLFPLLELGELHVDLPVETAGPHKGGVENVRAVCRREDDDAGIGPEAVHLGQKLVQGVLPFVVGGEAGVTRTGAAHRVDLIDEDDAGRLFLRLAEKVAHPGGAHADEHLHEIGARDREERHVGFAGDSLRKKGLAGAGRAHEEGSLGDFAAKGGVFLGVAEEIDDLHHFLLGAVETGDVLERHLGLLILLGELALGLAHVERIAAGYAGAAAHIPAESAEHPDPEKYHHDGPEYPLEDVAPDPVVILDLVIHGAESLAQLGETLLRVEFLGNEEEEVGRLPGNAGSAEAVGVAGKALGLDLDVALVVVTDEGYLLHVAFGDHLLHLGPLHLLRVGRAPAEQEVAYTYQ